MQAVQDAQTFTFTHRQWADAIPMWKMGLNQGVAEACYASQIYCAVEGDEDDDPDSDEDDYYSPASPKRYCVPQEVTVRDSLTELEMEHALNVMFHPDSGDAREQQGVRVGVGAALYLAGGGSRWAVPGGGDVLNMSLDELMGDKFGCAKTAMDGQLKEVLDAAKAKDVRVKSPPQ